jgi:hypothetical protein
MNKISIIFFSLLLAKVSFSQSTEIIPINAPISNKSYQIQGGLNVIGFVRQFVNFSGNNNNITTSPYSLNAKGFYFLKKSNSLIGLRLGAGFVSNNSSNETSTNKNESLTEESNFRIGFEYQKLITKRWIVYAGIDYISSNRVNNAKNSFFDQFQNVTFSSSNFSSVLDGGGLVFGVQFNLNKYLLISTESTFYYGDSYQITRTESSNQFNVQPPQVIKSKSTQLTLPNMLNFCFKF